MPSKRWWEVSIWSELEAQGWLRDARSSMLLVKVQRLCSIDSSRSSNLARRNVASDDRPVSFGSYRVTFTIIC